ncbi:helix-turn-helix domain-containing protein [Jeotgalibaca sp. A127]|uniref:helix-turn-helix domain-containing protein n=1 Tax=Jeotgalibaca sp. A127 TaxID=3457324 RepID=UPI003FD02A24
MEDLLKELFPEAKVNQSSWMGNDYFTVPLEGKFMHFASGTITDREKRLIIQMLEPDTVFNTGLKNVWAHYLLENPNPIPSGYERIQVLQVTLKQTSPEPIDRKLWLDAFKNTLSSIVDGFFVSEQYALFIIHNPDHFELTNEIEGVLNVLDDDFGIKSNAYLGQNWTVNSFLPALFLEEQSIFLDTRSRSQADQIVTLTTTALPHYTFEAASKSPILATIKEGIQNIDGGADLVYAMWQNQGNISKAATDLYVHRNTLQYRIDRFVDTIGLNLKKMDDLLLSYMALHARFK